MGCRAEPGAAVRERLERGSPICLGIDERAANVLEDRASYRQAGEVEDGAAPPDVRQRRVEQADALIEPVAVEQRIRASRVVARTLLVGHRRQRRKCAWPPPGRRRRRRRLRGTPVLR